jgi:hypothetical protein
MLYGVKYAIETVVEYENRKYVNEEISTSSIDTDLESRINVYAFF